MCLKSGPILGSMLLKSLDMLVAAGIHVTHALSELC